MFDFIQNNWMLALAFPGVFAFAMGMIVKFVNEKKLLKMTIPPARAAAATVSLFLRKQLGQRAAEKFENGFIITLCRVIRKTVAAFEVKLVEDNVER